MDTKTLLELAAASLDRPSDCGSDFRVGEAVLIRTVTNYWVGRIARVGSSFLTIDRASETKDAGRLSVTIEEGLEGQECTEIEFIGDGVRVSIGAIVDVLPYPHALPTATK